jgi:hypothetical protein
LVKELPLTACIREKRPTERKRDRGSELQIGMALPTTKGFQIDVKGEAWVPKYRKERGRK